MLVTRVPVKFCAITTAKARTAICYIILNITY